MRPNPPATQEASDHLPFVEGLRGIAAFVVMGNHAVQSILGSHGDYPLGTFGEASPWERLWWPWLFGAQMVVMFIFISGFSLYYREHRRRLRGISFNMRDFLRRRAWRVLPTYYVALLVSYALVAGLLHLGLRTGTEMDVSLRVSTEGLLSHLLLVHNFRPEWIYQFNTPLWSIAVEAQLYLLFPLILWVMLRIHPFFGAGLVIAAHWLVQGLIPFPFFQLTGSFVTGMVVAHIAVTAEDLPPKPLLLMACVALSVGLWLGPLQRSAQPMFVWLVGFSGLTLFLFRTPSGGWNVPTWAPFRALGKWSYSLYACHFPFLMLLYLVSLQVPLPYELKVIGMFIFGALLSVLVAYLLFTTVEQWSLKRMRGLRAQDDPKAAKDWGIAP